MKLKMGFRFDDNGYIQSVPELSGSRLSVLIYSEIRGFPNLTDQASNQYNLLKELSNAV